MGVGTHRKGAGTISPNHLILKEIRPAGCEPVTCGLEVPDNPLVRLRILCECPRTRQNITDSFLVRSSLDRRYVTLSVTPAISGPFVCFDDISGWARSQFSMRRPKIARVGPGPFCQVATLHVSPAVGGVANVFLDACAANAAGPSQPRHGRSCSPGSQAIVAAILPRTAHGSKCILRVGPTPIHVQCDGGHDLANCHQIEVAAESAGLDRKCSGGCDPM